MNKNLPHLYYLGEEGVGHARYNHHIPFFIPSYTIHSIAVTWYNFLGFEGNVLRKCTLNTS